MSEEMLASVVNAGSAAVVAYAFLRGLRVAEAVTYRLLDTIDRLCRTCEEEDQTMNTT